MNAVPPFGWIFLSMGESRQCAVKATAPRSAIEAVVLLQGYSQMYLF